jgi:hypothetical protein
MAAARTTSRSPLYRNPNFFTSAGQPNTTSCTATSTGYTTQNKGNLGQNKGKVQLGNPVAGTWGANTTGTQKGGFSFVAAPENPKAGVRTTGQIGEFAAVGPYLYSYIYAALRNDFGVFGPGFGPGNFTLSYTMGLQRTPPDGKGDAQIYVKQGLAKFGGTMRMLGSLTTKVCFFRNGGCSLGGGNWRYEAVGETVGSLGPVITQGYIATYRMYYYHTFLMQQSTVDVEGARFPWTTGSVTVKAAGRGPHKTIHYGQGYDNRNPVTHKGTIQMVTPVLTRWLQPCCKFETGGVGVLRIKFVPEPQTLVLLLAGVSLLGVGYRMRGR